MTHPDYFQVLVALDQLANTFLGGYADETLSSRAYRHKKDGSRSWPAWVIDHIFFWQDEHCKASYESELERAQLPPEFRE
ncbi:hypothetical protein [Parasutterella secunda]|uniref:hypothetical protein n=1 Tax=Parasutterella secunda TaxID=626947 RepID=UPI0025A36209|nr:hypothetical protein [Parasutterella secunda]MDM8227771.1 hypothetical protein [Parasutterella secunda]